VHRANHSSLRGSRIGDAMSKCQRQRQTPTQQGGGFRQSLLRPLIGCGKLLQGVSTQLGPHPHNVSLPTTQPYEPRVSRI
jgi:hypothetical protein